MSTRQTGAHTNRLHLGVSEGANVALLCVFTLFTLFCFCCVNTKMSTRHTGAHTKRPQLGVSEGANVALLYVFTCSTFFCFVLREHENVYLRHWGPYKPTPFGRLGRSECGPAMRLHTFYVFFCFFRAATEMSTRQTGTLTR